MKLAILIPTYNESQNISLLLNEIKLNTSYITEAEIEVYVIDDSSPDKTGELVNICKAKLNSNHFNINLITRDKKEGLGAAYISAFKYLLDLQKPPDLVLQMDADLSHNPIYISDFLHAATEGSDFVVGSRYIVGGSIPNWAWYRKILSKSGNYYSRIVLGNEITDYTGGYNLFSIALINKINFDDINHQGYGFLIALKYHALLLSKKTSQIPIKFLDRSFGHSKMPASTILKNFLLVLIIRFSPKRPLSSHFRK
jgi:dolichol-phosphate mannosyltransferase